MPRRFSIRHLLKISLPFFFFFLIAGPIFAGDKPFNHASNWGGTGLLEIPTARVLEDGTLRAGYAEARPFKWFNIAMGIFPGLEADFRLTEITGTQTRLGDQYGNNKDKALDLKYQLFPESRVLPAIAFGIQDFHGTRLFPSEYVVANRQIYPLDFTLGYGTKRLEGFFGGIEWAISDRIQLFAEYSPVDYKADRGGTDGKPPVPEGSDTPFNFGLNIRPVSGLNLAASYQRGNTLGFSVQFELDLGEEIMPKKPDPMFWGKYRKNDPDENRRTANPKPWLEEIKSEIEGIGIDKVSVSLKEAELTVECENARYLSNQKAVGRIFRIMTFSSPDSVEELKIVLKKRDIPILTASIKRSQFRQYAFGELEEDSLIQLVRVELHSDDKDDAVATEMEKGGRGNGKVKPADKPDVIKIGTEPVMSFDWGIKPHLQLYLNDPSGFLKGRVGAAPHFTVDLWKGASVSGRALIPFYSNIESSNETVPEAVRSDSWRYSGTGLSIDQLFFDQVVKLDERTFAKAGIGFFEEMYAGVSGEFLRFIGDGKLAIGLQGDYAVKREPEALLGLTDFKRNTILGNIYYKYTPFDLILHAQYGKFLAEDVGWRFTVTRSYDSGVHIGFWHSYTDTGHLTAFNKDYNDKGVFISIPIRMLTRSETNARYTYSLTPWTRDVAALVDHSQDLYGIVSELTPLPFNAGMDQMTQ